MSDQLKNADQPHKASTNPAKWMSISIGQSVTCTACMAMTYTREVQISAQELPASARFSDAEVESASGSAALATADFLATFFVAFGCLLTLLGEHTSC